MGHSIFSRFLVTRTGSWLFGSGNNQDRSKLDHHDAASCLLSPQVGLWVHDLHQSSVRPREAPPSRNADQYMPLYCGTLRARTRVAAMVIRITPHAELHICRKWVP